MPAICCGYPIRPGALQPHIWQLNRPLCKYFVTHDGCLQSANTPFPALYKKPAESRDQDQGRAVQARLLARLRSVVMRSIRTVTTTQRLITTTSRRRHERREQD
jgi:hypothetical protein